MLYFSKKCNFKLKILIKFNKNRLLLKYIKNNNLPPVYALELEKIQLQIVK